MSSTLSGCIVKSLKEREMISELPAALLNKSRTEALRHDETEYWDYKETIDLNNPIEIARLAKRVLAFHNARGGAIIFGIKDNYYVSGLAPGQILDTNKLHQKLRTYIGSNFSLFQDTIAVHNSKFVWIIFVPQKEEVPVAVGSNGPFNEKKRPEIRKGEFYVRVNDTVKLCVEQSDIYRLFGNVSLSHIEAYLYDIDEPYFRLLAPHCERFVGRKKQLVKVREALETRHPIIALDGLGGVGKSAIAIELVRNLYEAQKYMFIISQSAKSKVWHEHMATRKAGFSGLTEFLQGIAKVFDLPLEKELDKLKVSVINAMEGLEGLLLVDNIEDIYDSAVFSFLVYEVPAPVKVLVTSRVDKGLGPLTISIPQMDEEEARELLYDELKRVGYKDYYSEEENIKEILEATGKLPLALKWAALLATNHQSLREASHRLRKLDATKKEFLSFCFATMFDVLPLLAREVAVLGAYLGNECNTTILSIALDRSEDDIGQAIEELKEKGIMMDSFSDKRKALSFLPLTEDFLANKWNENKAFRDKVLQSLELKGIALNKTVEQRLEQVFKRVEILRQTGNYNEAQEQIKLALNWDSNNSKLVFLRGRILYESGRKRDGLNLMQFVVYNKKEDPEFIEEHLYLAQALIEYGTNKTTKEGMRLLNWALPLSSELTEEIVSVLIKASLELRDYRTITEALYRVSSPSVAVSIAKTIQPHLKDNDFVFWCGGTLPRTLRLALKANEISRREKSEFQREIQRVEQILEKGRNFHGLKDEEKPSIGKTNS